MCSRSEVEWKNPAPILDMHFQFISVPAIETSGYVSLMRAGISFEFENIIVAEQHRVGAAIQIVLFLLYGSEIQFPSTIYLY